MPENLALKYRPTNFDDLVGQRAVNVPLRQMLARDAVPTALLFAGCRGTGKTTTARILAASVNCVEDGPRPCGHCPSCKSIFDGTSYDVLEIDAASNNGIDNIRDIRQQVLYGVGGHCRVVILDEAHSMSGAAFNALLKTLEEPPPATVFILATTEPGRIPDTVASRCIPFTFGRIATADIAARLTAITHAEGATVEPALLTLLADRADGAMRDAIMALDQMLRAGVTTLAGYTDLVGDVDYAPGLLTAITTGDVATTFATLTDILTRVAEPVAVTNALTATLRDLLILRSGGTLTHQGEALTARRQLADALDVPTLFAAISVLWDAKTKIRPSEDARASLDLAVMMLCERFTRATAAAPATPPRRLSLADMAAMKR